MLTRGRRRGAARRLGRSSVVLAVTAALVLMTLAGASVLPPSRPIHAESLLGSPIPVVADPVVVVADPVNNRIYAASETAITVIDARTHQRLDPPITPPGPINGIDVNPITQRIYVSHPTSPGTVTVIDASSRSIVGTPITVGNDPAGVAVDPTTNRIYVANFTDNSVSVIDGASTANGGAGATLGNQIGVGMSPARVAVNPVLKRVYVTRIGGGVRVINSDGGGIAGEGTVLGDPIATGPGTFDVAVNPSTNRVYVTNITSNEIVVIDGTFGGTAGEGMVVGDPIDIGTTAVFVAVSPNAQRVYVSDQDSDTVTVINAASGENNGAGSIEGAPIAIGTGTDPQGLAVNTTSGFVYVANQGPDTVAVLGSPHLQHTVIAGPIPVGQTPLGVAVNPNTNRVYVTNAGSPGDPGNDSVSVLDGTTLQPVVGSPVTVGDFPNAVAVNPTTNRIYIANANSQTLTAIDGATNQTIGPPVAIGPGPVGVAVNPNPSLDRVYVSNLGTDLSGTTNDILSVFDGATLQPVAGSPITVGPNPGALAVHPGNNRVYVPLGGDLISPASGTVLVLDGSTHQQVAGSPVTVGNTPFSAAINPVTGRVYVSNQFSRTVSVIFDGTVATVGSPIAVPGLPQTVAVNPSTNLVYVPGVPTGIPPATEGVVTLIDGSAVENGGAGAVIGGPITYPSGFGLAAVNPNTGRVYLPIPQQGTLVVVGPTFSLSNVRAGAVPGVLPGTTIQVSWDKLFGLSGNDRIGLFAAGAANGLPASQVFTNGTGSGGGNGVVQGTVNLLIPASQAPGSYEVRFVSGHTDRTLGSLVLRVLATPVANNDQYSIAAGGTLTVPVGNGVLGNDSGVDILATATAQVVGQPASGILTLQANGAFTYAPAANVLGPVTFTYRVTDAYGLQSDTATVTITVTGERPVAVDDAYPLNSSGLTVPAATGVLANDVDDGPVSSLRAEVVTQPTGGTLQILPDGAFTYTPRTSQSVTDSFTYRLTDAQGLISSRIGTVTLTITGVACGPRPSVTVQSSVVNGELRVAVGANDVGAPTQNRLREIRFGTLQNAQVTLNGQAIVNDQVVTLPADAVEQAFTVRRATLGQPTTVPFTVVDTCGSWPTFVGGGPNAGF